MVRLMSLVALVLVMLIPSSAPSQGRPPLKIGLLLPYTGVLSIQGQDTTRGLELHLAKIGGKAGGREIQVLREDTEAKPDVGLTKVKKLVERDRVDFLVGPVSSAVALAIRNYVHEQGVPLVVPVAFTRDLTAPGRGASPSIFRVIETSDQGDYPMGAWLIKNTKYRKLVVMFSDFVAGRHASEAFVAGFKAAGGEVVKEIFAPLNTADFAPYLTQAASFQADAVWGWFAGADSIRFVKQYKEYGLWEKMPLIGYNTLVDDTILPAQGDSALGIVTHAGYTAALDTPENKAFVREYEQKHGIWPSRYAESGYLTAQLITAAIDLVGGEVSDRGKVRDALKRAITQIKPPRGPVSFDAYNQCICPIFIMKTEKQGSRVVNAVIDKIPAVSQEATWGWWKK
jgi:branched-chain amino acid transport system substrate-binding protein